MDRVNPNCIAGASNPYKVVSFSVAARGPGSVCLSVSKSHCTAWLEGYPAFDLVLRINWGIFGYFPPFFPN